MLRGDVVVIHVRKMADPSQMDLPESGFHAIEPRTVEDFIVCNFGLPLDSHSRAEILLVKVFKGFCVEYVADAG